jgi:hypothetical protein
MRGALDELGGMILETDKYLAFVIEYINQSHGRMISNQFIDVIFDPHFQRRLMRKTS